MTEHLTWCKSLQGGTAVDCNCEQARKWIVGEIATIAADNARLESENARLRKAIEKHRDAEGGGIHTYSWYDKELYKALDAIEAATKEESNGNG